MTFTRPPMPTNALRTDPAPGRIILDVEGAREVGPTEAAGLIRECLALAIKRWDGATWRALDELEAAAPRESDARRGATRLQSPESKIALAVRRERGKFFSRFRSEFEQLFRARRAGETHERTYRGGDIALALVDESDQAGQVALKSAVHQMRAATREEGFGFDLRTRMVLREPSESSEFENPWGAELLCNALGNACRGLWAEDGAWRPVMEHLVRALTPDLVALHRELDQLLQDRDVLPVLHVRTRKRAGATAGGKVDPSAGHAAPSAGGDLYHQIVELMARAPPAAGTWVATAGIPPPGAAPGPTPATDPLNFGNPDAWRAQSVNPTGAAAVPGAGPSPWQALQRVLEMLEGAAAPGMAFEGLPAAGQSGETAGSVLPVLKAAIAAEGVPPLDRVTLEIIAAVLDEIFESRYLPAAVKAVFGRLQIPILKAALLDPEVLSNPRHGVRKFFDTLAAASVGVRPEIAHDARFLELASKLALAIRERLAESADVFTAARGELDTFLDAERAAYNQKLAQALPLLVGLDEDAHARTLARIALSVRYAGRSLPPEVRDYLEHEGVARLSAAYRRDGPGGAAAMQAIELFDELAWSVAPEHVPGFRNRLLQAIPPLVRALSEGWATDDAARVRRKVFLARLYELHVEALNTRVDFPFESDTADEADLRARGANTAPDRTAVAQRDVPVEDVESLQRGDWCEFAGEAGQAPLLAKFAWRAPHGTRFLFTHRDGDIAVIHTPESLGQAFRSGQAKVAIEAVPLFERAMERLIERHLPTAPT